MPQTDKRHSFMSWVCPIWVRGLFHILENLSRLRIHSDFMQAIGALDVEGGLADIKPSGSNASAMWCHSVQ